jgi:hypothetical protein
MVLAQIMMVCAASVAQDSALHIKAAFIYKFCGYTTWPDAKFPSENAPIRVGVAGSQRVVDEIHRVFAGKTIRGRSLVVYKIDATSDLTPLHLLYVNESSHFDLLQFSALHQQEPILTITEKSALPELAIINFVPYEDFIRFAISKTRAMEVGLEISSQLLSVAVAVE